MKRLLIAALVALTAGVIPVSAKQYPQIEYVRGRYMNAQAFQRISEFFDEQENQGGDIILRTDPKVRQGFYFILTLDGDASEYPAGTRIGIKYIDPRLKEPVVKATSLPTPIEDTYEIWVGLTGADAPEAGDPPVAWLIVLYDPKGKVFAHYKSYLWEKPEDAEANE